jgi:hypothetical protein
MTWSTNAGHNGLLRGAANTLKLIRPAGTCSCTVRGAPSAGLANRIEVPAGSRSRSEPRSTTRAGSGSAGCGPPADPSARSGFCCARSDI